MRVFGHFPGAARPCRPPLPRLVGASGVKPKKSLGQHFLVDESVILDIVERAHVTSSDLVLEIGPGTGALTTKLSGRCGFLAAIEADKRLAGSLQQRLSQATNVQIVHGDALKVNMRKAVAELIGSHGKRLGAVRVKVIANLPYYITTEILKILLPLGSQISELYLMLQVEAAERLTGGVPGNTSYRAINVLVDYYSTSEVDLKVGRAAFYPVPEVDSAMVRFTLKDKEDRPPVSSEEEFLRLVSVCFSARRKFVRNNLKTVFPAHVVTEAMHALAMDDNVRPQELEVLDYTDLSIEIDKAMRMLP